MKDVIEALHLAAVFAMGVLSTLTQARQYEQIINLLKGVSQ